MSSSYILLLRLSVCPLTHAWSGIFQVVFLYFIVETFGLSTNSCRCCIADHPPYRPSPGRSATLQTSPPRKICNIADLLPEDLQHCRPSSNGEGLQHCRSSPFHCRSFPGEDLQHCRPSPIFVKFGYIEKGVLNHYKRLYMQYLMFND